MMVDKRKRSYLEALVRPFTAGKPEEEALVTAQRRGYLLGRHFGHDGKRPTATDKERDQANKDAANYIVTWFDSPALRSNSFDAVAAEDVNLVNARLTVTPLSTADPSLLTLPDDFTAEPPALDDQAAPRMVLMTASRMGVDVFGDIRGIL
ncbi:MAG: hypothetical protein JO287_20350, partial [Pseudonocardiales bacterium]|nr:hypothetical protein [Pseudonocardiales bacterium]